MYISAGEKHQVAVLLFVTTMSESLEAEGAFWHKRAIKIREDLLAAIHSDRYKEHRDTIRSKAARIAKNVFGSIEYGEKNQASFDGHFYFYETLLSFFHSWHMERSKANKELPEPFLEFYNKHFKTIKQLAEDAYDRRENKGDLDAVKFCADVIYSATLAK